LNIDDNLITCSALRAIVFYHDATALVGERLLIIEDS